MGRISIFLFSPLCCKIHAFQSYTVISCMHIAIFMSTTININNLIWFCEIFAIFTRLGHRSLANLITIIEKALLLHSGPLQLQPNIETSLHFSVIEFLVWKSFKIFIFLFQFHICLFYFEWYFSYLVPHQAANNWLIQFIWGKRFQKLLSYCLSTHWSDFQANV